MALLRSTRRRCALPADDGREAKEEDFVSWGGEDRAGDVLLGPSAFRPKRAAKSGGGGLRSTGYVENVVPAVRRISSLERAKWRLSHSLCRSLDGTA
jgi:hypothetical protein